MTAYEWVSFQRRDLYNWERCSCVFRITLMYSTSSQLYLSYNSGGCECQVCRGQSIAVHITKSRLVTSRQKHRSLFCPTPFPLTITPC